MIEHLGIPKRRCGWDGVASAIVVDLAHLLPPQALNWPDWFLSGTCHYREDGSLVIDTYEGRWRDEQIGEGGTVFTLLVRLLGSWGAARSWLRRNDYMHGAWTRPEERARREPRTPPEGPKRERRGSKGRWLLESCAPVPTRGGAVPCSHSSCRRPIRAVAR